MDCDDLRECPCCGQEIEYMTGIRCAAYCGEVCCRACVSVNAIDGVRECRECAVTHPAEAPVAPVEVG